MSDFVSTMCLNRTMSQESLSVKVRCVSRKNGILKLLSFTKICTYLTHFDIPALITLHTYNLSICDKRQHVHRSISCPANFV